MQPFTIHLKDGRQIGLSLTSEVEESGGGRGFAYGDVVNGKLVISNPDRFVMVGSENKPVDDMRVATNFFHENLEAKLLQFTIDHVSRKDMKPGMQPKQVNEILLDYLADISRSL